MSVPLFGGKSTLQARLLASAGGSVTAQRDRRGGRIEITKSKSREKVDGAIGLAMAIGVAHIEGMRSVYEERPAFLWV